MNEICNIYQCSATLTSGSALVSKASSAKIVSFFAAVPRKTVEIHESHYKVAG